MKLFLRTLLLLSLFTPAGLALAHGDHGTISETWAKQVAAKTVQQMTFKDMGHQAGKLDASWKSVQPSDIKVVTVGKEFYVLHVTNSETKQSLSIKIAFTGQVLEATENTRN
ncbi:MAG: DUF6488 family protein [Porticoccaceae bacterium]